MNWNAKNHDVIQRIYHNQDSQLQFRLDKHKITFIILLKQIS